MKNNTLAEIKQTEAAAKEAIAQARQKVENLALQTNQNGEKSLNNAENQVSPQIEAIIETAKKEIQNLKVKQDQELAKRLQELNSIDSKTIAQAASLVTKEITK